MKCLQSFLLAILSTFMFSATAGLNIGTYNIRNFDKPGSHTNKKLLKENILKASPDLLAVEEIFNHSSFKSFVAKELKGYSVALSNCGGGGSQKLGFIYRSSKLKLKRSYEDRRLTSAFDNGCGSLRPAYVGVFEDLESQKDFVAIAVHLKAGSGSRNFERRATQYSHIKDMFAEFEAEGHDAIVAMGDFNTTGYDHRNQDYRNFQRLLSSAGASTSAQEVACTSYWSGADYNDGIEEASTLDHVVYNRGFASFGSPKVELGGHCAKARCEDVYEDVLGEGYQTVSDHCPVTVSF